MISLIIKSEYDYAVKNGIKVMQFGLRNRYLLKMETEHGYLLDEITDRISTDISINISDADIGAEFTLDGVTYKGVNVVFE